MRSRRHIVAGGIASAALLADLRHARAMLTGRIPGGSIPLLSQTFTQAVAYIGLGNPQYDWVFGSSAVAGAGQTAITNQTQLSAAFQPYQDGGVQTINAELEWYPAFNSVNHAFATDRLNLTATVDTAQGYSGAYQGAVSQGNGGSIFFNGTATAIASLGLADTSTVSLGQVVGFQSHGGPYYVSAIVTNTSVTLLPVNSGASASTITTTKLVFWTPYVALLPTASIGFHATTFTVSPAPPNMANGMALFVGNPTFSTRYADYRVSGWNSGTGVVTCTALGAEFEGSGRILIAGPPITSGQIWTKNRYWPLNSANGTCAWSVTCAWPTDASGGYSSRGVNTLSAFNTMIAAAADVPLGAWPINFWLFGTTALAGTRTSSELDNCEMQQGLTTDFRGWSATDHLTNGAASVYPNLVQYPPSGWNTSWGFGFITSPTTLAGQTLVSQRIHIPAAGLSFQYLNGTLMAVDTFTWASTPGQLGIDFAMGSFTSSNMSNGLIPYAAAGINKAFGVLEIQAWGATVSAATGGNLDFNTNGNPLVNVI